MSVNVLLQDARGASSEFVLQYGCIVVKYSSNIIRVNGSFSHDLHDGIEGLLRDF